MHTIAEMTLRALAPFIRWGFKKITGAPIEGGAGLSLDDPGEWLSPCRICSKMALEPLDTRSLITWHCSACDATYDRPRNGPHGAWID